MWCKLAFVYIAAAAVLIAEVSADRTQNPRCYFGTKTEKKGNTYVTTYPRTDCGYRGITKWLCEKVNGCCYDDTIPNTNHCFHVDNHPSTSSGGDENKGAKPSRDGNNGFWSTIKNFGSKIFRRRTKDNRCYFEAETTWTGQASFTSYPRKDCGYPGITQETCESRGCCYDNTIPHTKHCFYKDNVPKSALPRSLLIGT